MTETLNPAARWRRFRNRVWKLAPDPAESVTLTRHNIYVLPSKQGLGFTVALTLMLLAAMNYAVSLGYALVFLLAGAGLAGLMHSFRNQLGITILRGTEPEAYAGQLAPFTLVLSNHGQRERHKIQLSCGSGDSETTVVVEHLAPGETRAVRIDVPAPRRGRQPLGRVTVETQYPLGVWQIWSYVHFQLAAWVYPTPEPHAPMPPANYGDRHAGTRLAAGGDEFSGLRSYQSTDSPSRIAWKSVARAPDPTDTRYWQSKAFAHPAGGDAIFAWDDLPTGMDGESRLQRLCAWVLAADRSGLRFGLRLPGLELPLDSGPDQRRRALQALALAPGAALPGEPA